MEDLRESGFFRIILEMLGLFAAYLILFSLAEPFIQSLAPETFAQTGIDYSRTDLPDTSMEVLHLTLACLITGTFLYCRLYRTETGRDLIELFEK